jgi:hypothetical protein
VERPKPDADDIAVLPGLLEQRERIAAELQRMPKDPLSARHQGNVTRDRWVSYGHLPRS